MSETMATYLPRKISFISIFVLFYITLINIRQTISDNTLSISDANNHLAFNLLKRLADDEHNVLISPLAIASLLNMIYLGANDRTAAELQDLMALRQYNLTQQQVAQQYRQLFDTLFGNKSNNNELIVANGLFAQSRNPILERYSTQLRDNFNASIQTVDFLFKSEATVKEINEWMARMSRGKVAKMLAEPLSPLSVLVLLNAVYFKGKWRQQFLKWATKEEDFHTFNKAIKTPHMKLSNAFNYTTLPALDNSQLIELPYSTASDVSMYVLLPNQTTGVRSVCQRLTSTTFAEAINNLTVTTVRLVLPKFQIETSYTLKSSLQALGLQQVFTYKSDLSGIDGTNYLHISELFHNTMLEVSEEGYATNGTTGPVANSRGLFGRYRNVPTFRADRPFLFAVRHKSSGLILLTGLLNRPLNR